MNKKAEQEKTNAGAHNSQAYVLDSEIATVLASYAIQGAPPSLKRGDWKSLRESGNAMWKLWSNAAPVYPDVKKKSFFMETFNGESI